MSPTTSLVRAPTTHLPSFSSGQPRPVGRERRRGHKAGGVVDGADLTSGESLGERPQSFSSVGIALAMATYDFPNDILRASRPLFSIRCLQCHHAPDTANTGRRFPPKLTTSISHHELGDRPRQLLRMDLGWL